MAGTPRLSLPFLAVGQAQKEFTHNESLQTLDVLVTGSVEEPPRATPPTSPTLGACYIVGDPATGAWAGRTSSLAAWTSGGWRFIAPIDGMRLYDRTSGTFVLFPQWCLGERDRARRVAGNRRPAGRRRADRDH